ncbi:MAG: hypothetical protein KME02_11410 [Aphanothece saxicola GSE-SYN-MK-01-06B]|jgi:hypothetical protein|nr:hypothetical protein [Aphanothece saxicola GSE-SYN-MK-01-06B]
MTHGAFAAESHHRQVVTALPQRPLPRLGALEKRDLNPHSHDRQPAALGNHRHPSVMEFLLQAFRNLPVWKHIKITGSQCAKDNGWLIAVVKSLLQPVRLDQNFTFRPPP